MAVSDQEFTQVKEDLKQTQGELKIIADILFGINDDPRFKAKVRKQLFEKDHATDKPTIINANGKKYNLETV